MDKIQKAIKEKKTLRVAYYGGSQPGTIREIIPLSIADNKLRAHCLMSNLEKKFFVNKIQIIDDDAWIIGELGKCMERDSSFDVIKDAKKLPYPREVILESLCRHFSIEEDDSLREQLKVGLLFLASYQEDVGVEDLHRGGLGSGFENLMTELAKFPREEQEKYIKDEMSKNIETLKPDQKKQEKYEYFDKLCKKDQVLFYSKIGCSWPPTISHPNSGPKNSS